MIVKMILIVVVLNMLHADFVGCVEEIIDVDYVDGVVVVVEVVGVKRVVVDEKRESLVVKVLGFVVVVFVIDFAAGLRVM